MKGVADALEISRSNLTEQMSADKTNLPDHEISRASSKFTLVFGHFTDSLLKRGKGRSRILPRLVRPRGDELDRNDESNFRGNNSGFDGRIG